MIKQHLLKYALYVAGITAFAAFVVTRDEELVDDVTANSYRNGDLYRLALIKDFKMDIPDRCVQDESDTVWQDQRIMFIGDSFSESCRGHKPLPAMIAEALNEPVFHIPANESPEYFNPIVFLKEKHIQRGKKRLIILERVERYIRSSFEDELDMNPMPDSGGESFGSKVQHLGNRWFSTHDEELYQFLLQSSDVSRPVVEWWNTAMFHLIKKISTETPVYSLHPPFLFYFDETDPSQNSSYYSHHPDTLIESIASNIQELKAELAQRYNAELLFMPVPSKYTLYHSVVNNDPYDEYLPRLRTALESKAVRTVDLYNRFKDAKDTLYFPTDTHWNAQGATIAFRETMRVVKQIKSLEFN
ncbi:MAG: hypothetical protein ABI623_06595 [bacterium]